MTISNGTFKWYHGKERKSMFILAPARHHPIVVHHRTLSALCPFRTTEALRSPYLPALLPSWSPHKSRRILVMITAKRSEFRSNFVVNLEFELQPLIAEYGEFVQDRSTVQRLIIKPL